MQRNNLYPVFLKVHEFRVLIVGAGMVAAEKLHFLLKSSPLAQLTLVAPEVSQDVKDVLTKYPDARVDIIGKRFEPEDLNFHQIVISATSFPEINEEVYRAAKEKGILVNVADNPPLCDFYMGSIVNKGNIKIAISTNGKSPTLAKRLRQYFEEVLPNDIDQLAINLNRFRKSLINQDFEEKVKILNKATEKLLS